MKKYINFYYTDNPKPNKMSLLQAHLPSLLDGAVLSGVGLGTDRGEEPRGGAESEEPL